MKRETALKWSSFNILTKKRYEALRKVFGSLDEAYTHLDENLLTQLGCREETRLRVLSNKDEFNLVQYEKELQKRNLTFITIEDDTYPSKLKLIDDPPVFLYYRGDLSVLENPCIALVGTRGMSDYGKRVTEEFVPAIVRAGMITISGLAFGIDALVAKETLIAGGKTVAVLGHGLGMIYPKAHGALAQDIIKTGGLILSEFPLDILPGKYTFPARNRIIAGLSIATIILEASQGSGSLITADLALDYNRDVFAVPGQIFDQGYSGCHEIIRKGYAQLVSSPQEVLEAIGIVVPENASSSISFDSKEEEQMYDSLTTMPQSLDDIALKTKLDAARLNALLTILELKGAAKLVGEGKWVKT